MFIERARPVDLEAILKTSGLLSIPSLLTPPPHPHTHLLCELKTNKQTKPHTKYILGFITGWSRQLFENTRCCIPTFIAALFTIATMWKQPQCPSVDKRIKKLWYIYTAEYYSAIKKKETLPFATAWMDLERIMLSEISQSEKGKYHIISLICGIL